MSVLPEHPPFVFRLNENGTGPDLLRQVFLERGWSEFEEDRQFDYDWNLWWRTSRFRTSDYDVIYPWQRLNHYPKSTLITKKDCLARNLKRMRCVHGANVFNFSPMSFNLPNDYTKYVKVYGTLRQKEKSDGRMPLWICKPADLSRGRGIFIFRDLSELMYDCNAVVQHYIDNPLLIGGYKCDLRIYVAVISFQPLRVYVHEEGIVRFGTAKFDLDSTNNIFAHLTNTSINKHSPGYTEDKEKVGPGCKWTLTQLRQYFLRNNVNDRMLWRRIVNIVILTLLIQAPQVQKVDNCFELYGFDILIDENLKPWLLEVNFSPSLSSDCQADIVAKKSVLHDLLDLLHFKGKDAERGGEDFRHYYSTFSEQATTQRRGSFSYKGANHKRDRKSYRQARHSARANDPDNADSGGGYGLPLMRQQSVSQDNVMAKDGRGDGRPGASVAEERGGMPNKRGVSTERASEGEGRNYVEEMLDSVMDQALMDREMLVNSTSQSPPLLKAQAKASVSADSHNSSTSTESKASKLSADSGIASYSESSEELKLVKDGGVAGASTSVGGSAKSRKESTFGSLPEVPSLSRLGSGLRRVDSLGSYELSLHLPSLENSASSKRSRKSKNSLLTPRSVSNSVCDGQDPCERGRLRSEGLAQSRSKSMSTKSLHTIGQEQSSSQHYTRGSEEYPAYPLSHRSLASVSVASVKSSSMAGSRRAMPQRNQSSRSQGTGVPRFMQPHPRQQRFQVNKSAQQGGFASLSKRVGDFHLIFPFNDVTHKMSQTNNMDMKTVIRESLRLLKDALNTVSSSKSGVDPFHGAESEGLWSPLRPLARDS